MQWIRSANRVTTRIIICALDRSAAFQTVHTRTTNRQTISGDDDDDDDDANDNNNNLLTNRKKTNFVYTTMSSLNIPRFDANMQVS